MKVLVLGLCCGMLLAISAIADERPQNAWFSALDHNGNDSISLNELQAVRNEKFYLLDINRDEIISLGEVKDSTIWSQRFIRLDTNTDGVVNLAEFETMALAVFSLFDINADGQITAREARKFQHKVMKQASTKKVSK